MLGKKALASSTWPGRPSAANQLVSLTSSSGSPMGKVGRTSWRPRTATFQDLGEYGVIRRI